MTSRTHDMFALSTLVTVSAFYPPSDLNLPTLFAALIGCVIGSLLPDMDQASNRLWDMLPAGDYVGKLFRRIFLGHRTLSHSLLGIFLFYKFLEFVLPKFLNPQFIDPRVALYAIMLGILSHLVADSLTEEGVPLLFPFGFKIGFPPIKSWRIKTGQWFENLVVFPSTLIYLFAFMVYNQNRLLDLLRLVTDSI